MNCSFRHKCFLVKRDFCESVKNHWQLFLHAVIVTMIGIGVGVYIGIRIGERETPFSIFAGLFHLNYQPFSYLLPDLFRFILYTAIASLAFFLPLPIIYPTLAYFFFGKYFGQAACISFLSDSVAAATLSLAIIYLPFVMIGTILFFFVTLKTSEFRLCKGADFHKYSLSKVVICLLKPIALYFFSIFLIYVPICGIIYLLVIAV